MSWHYQSPLQGFNVYSLSFIGALLLQLFSKCPIYKFLCFVAHLLPFTLPHFAISRGPLPFQTVNNHVTEAHRDRPGFGLQRLRLKVE